MAAHFTQHFQPRTAQHQLSHTRFDGHRMTIIPPLSPIPATSTTAAPGLHPQPSLGPSNGPDSQGKFGLEAFAHFLHAFHTQYNDPSLEQDGQGTTHPHFDLAETKSGYTIWGELAGLERKDVTVETNDLMFIITISGVLTRALPEEKKKPVEEQHPEYFDHGDEGFEGGTNIAAEPALHWHIQERHFGKFSRAFHLPFGSANMAAVNATMKDGLLCVTVPKTIIEMYREGVRPGRKVEIRPSSADIEHEKHDV